MKKMKRNKSKSPPAHPAEPTTRTGLKVGDWCIHDYAVKQIKRIEGEIIEVSDGTSLTSETGINCFPLTLANKVWANSIESLRLCLKRARGEQHLNWPDISRAFRVHADQLFSIPEENEASRKLVYDRLNEFVRQLKDSLSHVMLRGVENVFLLSS